MRVLLDGPRLEVLRSSELRTALARGSYAGENFRVLELARGWSTIIVAYPELALALAKWPRRPEWMPIVLVELEDGWCRIHLGRRDCAHCRAHLIVGRTIPDLHVLSLIEPTETHPRGRRLWSLVQRVPSGDNRSYPRVL